MKKRSVFLLYATLALPLSAQYMETVSLYSAANFAVLAGSTITNTGATSVAGNLGVSPGTAVTGFPPGTMNGVLNAGDTTAAKAIADLTLAFNDAARRTLAPVSVAGNIGGRTLTPGLYKSTSSLEISSGHLTLDARGDPNAVFIFQIASTLTTASGLQVILAGGAQASNIFWQVGSSATLGTTSVFKGTILADQSITLNTGATLEGRVLARIGGVTLAGNSITTPTPLFNLAGVVNAASYTAPVAAGSIAAVFGKNLAFGEESAIRVPLPYTLAQSTTRFGGSLPGEGEVVSAPLFFASSAQVNLQIPWELAGQTQTTMLSTVGTVAAATQVVTIAAFAPGIFAMNEAGTGLGAILIGGTGQLASVSRPAERGEYLSIFCTGLGAVSNQPVSGTAALASPLSVTRTTPTVSVGGVNAVVTYSGLAPGFVGVYQVNVQLPEGVASGSAVPVVITISGAPASNTVTIAVR